MYLYGNADPAMHIDPSGYIGLLDTSFALNIQSSLRAGQAQSYRVVVKKSGCLLIKAVAEETITQGVYLFIEDSLDGINKNSGKTYVGRTNDFKRRLNEHVNIKIKQGAQLVSKLGINLPPNTSKVVSRILEQYLIDALGGKDGLSNVRNEIALNPRSKASKELREFFNKVKICK